MNIFQPKTKTQLESSTHPQTSWRAPSSADSFEPLTDTYHAQDGSFIKLVDSKKHGLVGAVLHPDGRLSVINGNRIINPLNPKAGPADLATRLRNARSTSWVLTHDTHATTLTIWPRLEAAAKQHPDSKFVFAHPDVNWCQGLSDEQIRQGLIARGFRPKNESNNRWVKDGSILEYLIDTNKAGVTDEGPHVDLIYKTKSTYIQKDGTAKTVAGVVTHDNYIILKKKFPIDYNDPRWEVYQRNLLRRDGGEAMANQARGAGFTETAQTTGTAQAFSSASPEHPIAEQAGGQGQLGGVELDPGIIVGMKDNAADITAQEGTFLFATPDGNAPFPNEELSRILRELAAGIFYHGARPAFSLHFNNDGSLFPVIHPAYANTSIGNVMAMLDYMMKGYLNGGIYDESTVRAWLQDRRQKPDNLIDLREYFGKFMGSPDKYFSLREMLQYRDVPSDVGGLKFRSSFRIIADTPIVRAGETFVIKPRIRVKYEIEGSPELDEWRRQHQAEHGSDPEIYRDLESVYSYMASEIAEKMPQIPMCREYFNKLAAIQFFAAYFSTLKGMQRLPVLQMMKPPAPADVPSLFPSLPIRTTRQHQGRVNGCKVLENMSREHQARLADAVFRFPPVGSRDREGFAPRLELATAQGITDAYLGAVAEQIKGTIPQALKPEDDSSTQRLAGWIVTNIVEFLESARMSRSGLRPHMLTRLGLPFQTASTHLGDRKDEPFSNYTVVGGCLLDAKSAVPEPMLWSEQQANQLAINLREADDEEFVKTEVDGECFHAMKMLLVDYAAPTRDSYAFMTELLSGKLLFEDESSLEAVANLLLEGNHLALEAFTKAEAADKKRAASWRDGHGHTLMHYAARANNVDVAKELAKWYVKGDTRDDAGNTALHLAAAHGSIDMIRYLTPQWLFTKPTATLQAVNHGGADALYMACQHGQLEAATLLLDTGALPHATVSSGMSTLGTAIHHGHTAIAKLLLARGAAPNGPQLHESGKAEDAPGPLHVACALGNIDVVRALLEAGAHAHYRQRDNMTPLHLAAQGGHLEICRLLLGAKCDISIVDQKLESGSTALHLAAAANHEGVVTALLEAGARITAPGLNGATPLMSALSYGAPGVALRLIEALGATPVATEAGTKALTFAARTGQGPIVDALIEKGETRYQTDARGWNMAHHLCNLGQAQRLLRYVRAGVISQEQLRSRDAHGRTPLQIALRARQPQVAALFRSSKWPGVEGDGAPTLHAWINGGDSVTLLSHLKRKGDKESVCRERASPFYRHSLAYAAAAAGQKRQLELLLKAGAATSYVVEKVAMHLLCAAVEGRSEACVDLVLDHMTPEVSVRSSQGETLAQMAVKAGSIDMLKHLSSRGYAAKEEDARGQNALDTALAERNHEVIAYLVGEALCPITPELMQRAAAGTDAKALGKLLEKVPAGINDALLSAAVRGGLFENVRLLLDRGVRMSDSDASDSPMVLAAQLADTRILEALLNTMP